MRTSHLVVSSLALSLGVLQGTAQADYSESFESGLGAWTAETMNGSLSNVNMDRASDGVSSVGNMFTVPDSYQGWTQNPIISLGDMRTIMNTGATSLSMDVYSDWANPQGWGVYGNQVNLLFNSDAGWNPVGPTTGSLTNGAFSTLTWDLTALAPLHANPANSYAQLAVVWHVGTWSAFLAGDNGTQTFGIDNINIIQPIPEPASLSLLGLAGLAAIRRRR